MSGADLHSQAVPDGDAGPALTAKRLTSRLWALSRTTDLELAPAIRFNVDGTTGLSGQPGVARWSIEGGILVLSDEAGVACARFDDVVEIGPRRLWRGRVPGDGAEGTCLYLESWFFRHILLRPDTTQNAYHHLIATMGFSVGRFTYGVPHAVGTGLARLTIGNFTSIAMGVTIVVDNHNVGSVTTFPFATRGYIAAETGFQDHVTKGDVVIGSDVWIGQNAFIGSGVTICDGAVVAASAVVTKDVAPYSIVGGNPARLLRMRFDDELIRRLLAVSWWNWADDRVEAAMFRLNDGDVAGFLADAEAGLL